MPVKQSLEVRVYRRESPVESRGRSQGRRFRKSLPVTGLVERSAELQDPRTGGFHGDGKGKARRFIKQQDHSIQLAFPGAPCQRQTDRVKQLTPSQFHLLFQLRDY